MAKGPFLDFWRYFGALVSDQVMQVCDIIKVPSIRVHRLVGCTVDFSEKSGNPLYEMREDASVDGTEGRADGTKNHVERAAGHVIQ